MPRRGAAAGERHPAISRRQPADAAGSRGRRRRSRRLASRRSNVDAVPGRSAQSVEASPQSRRPSIGIGLLTVGLRWAAWQIATTATGERARGPGADRDRFAGPCARTNPPRSSCQRSSPAIGCTTTATCSPPSLPEGPLDPGPITPCRRRARPSGRPARTAGRRPDGDRDPDRRRGRLRVSCSASTSSSIPTRLEWWASDERSSCPRLRPLGARQDRRRRQGRRRPHEVHRQPRTFGASSSCWPS